MAKTCRVGGGPIVYGADGTLVMESRDGKPVVREAHGGEKTTVHEVEPLPEGRHDIAHEFVHHLDTAEPVHPTLDMHFNPHAMAILDAGVRSADSGRLEPVDSHFWSTG